MNYKRFSPWEYHWGNQLHLDLPETVCAWPVQHLLESWQNTLWLCFRVSCSWHTERPGARFNFCDALLFHEAETSQAGLWRQHIIPNWRCVIIYSDYNLTFATATSPKLPTGRLWILTVFARSEHVLHVSDYALRTSFSWHKITSSKLRLTRYFEDHFYLTWWGVRLQEAFLYYKLERSISQTPKVSCTPFPSKPQTQSLTQNHSPSEVVPSKYFTWLTRFLIILLSDILSFIGLSWIPLLYFSSAPGLLY